MNEGRLGGRSEAERFNAMGDDWRPSAISATIFESIEKNPGSIAFNAPAGESQVRLRFRSAFAALMLGMIIAGPILSEQPGTSPASNGSVIVFVPPQPGMPADRAGAGTRSFRAQASKVILLVPPDGGVTTLAKPPLVWRLKERFVGTVLSQITEVGKPGSAVAQRDNGRFRPSLYGFNLEWSRLALSPGGLYEWKVSLIDAKNNKVVDQAVGYVQRLATGATGESGAEVSTELLARQGLWFDALDRLIRIDLSGAVTVLEKADFDMLTVSAGVAN